MKSFFKNIILGQFNYLAAVALILIGLYAVTYKRSFLKKIIGLTIFQTAIILFFISIGYKVGASAPVIPHGKGHEFQNFLFQNPLPQVLMLTAIVVGVAVTGLALALLEKIYDEYGSIEENEILEQLRKDDA